jgi:putrescine aminotransferase
MNSNEIRAACEATGNPFAARALARLGAGVAVGAKGATIRLSDGREVVDLASGGFGYGHPRVLEVVADQVRRMPLSSRMFYSIPLARLARRLAHLLPGGLEVCFFGNSGTEAVEGALKLVKGYHRDRRRIVAATGAYHGASTGALAVSGIEPFRSRFSVAGRQSLEVELIPFGDSEALHAVDEETAAVILEPVQAGQGVCVPPRGYLNAARARCSAVGALLVIDEITTGLGRTGRLWGVDHDGATPDVVVLAGALGGGALPIGCYVATKEINDRVYDKQDPLLHANTTGGNPSACVAALAALDVVEQENLPSRAAKGGRVIEHFIARIRSRFGHVVTGGSARGLLASMSVSSADSALAVQREAMSRGALVRVDGLSGGVPSIGLRPPLIIDELELTRGLEVLESALHALAPQHTLPAPAFAQVLQP